VSHFPARVDAFLDELFRLEPVLATDAGLHDHDARWPDPSVEGEALLLAFAERWTAELTAMADLAPDEAIDRDFLLLELDALRFSVEELRELDWDALAWVYAVGAGLFPLVAREFAPPAVRLASLAGRLEGLPDLLRVAEERLGSRPELRPSRLHAETALRQVAGIRALIDEALVSAETAATEGGDRDVAALLPRLREAAATGRRALDDFVLHLERRILPIAEGDGRLGPERFAAKLRRTLKGAAPTPEEVEAAAEREFGAVRAEMVRLARELWPSWGGGAPLPSSDEATVRAVLDAIGAEHGEAGEILDFCRAEVARIEAFCRERGLISLPEEPLAIEWTPAFLRSGGGAMLIPPGPLDRGERAFFAVTPIPDEWSPEQRESYLREDNDRMLRLLSIHEAVPGHYLQLAAANRCPSLARIVLSSGVFAEGWAVYVTQVMMDLGYGAEDPALMLVHWKFYLRAVVNALIDVRIHTRGMTLEAALDLMVRGGFQEEAEARAKWDRARLTSTQLSTYFVGSLEMWRLERDRRVTLAIASGDPRGAAAVPEARVVGGLGETPGFSYRAHLEAVIAHGTPPIPVLRRILLGE
jgi:uncharacterized protein (DUF885 family)